MLGGVTGNERGKLVLRDDRECGARGDAVPVCKGAEDLAERVCGDESLGRVGRLDDGRSALGKFDEAERVDRHWLRLGHERGLLARRSKLNGSLNELNEGEQRREVVELLKHDGIARRGAEDADAGRRVSGGLVVSDDDSEAALLANAGRVEHDREGRGDKGGDCSA